MSGRKNLFGICDTCGFRYKLNQLKKNSYGMMQCPTDFDGQFDLKNHPQNRSPRIDERFFIKDARPENNDDRNILWNNEELQWENNNGYWNLV